MHYKESTQANKWQLTSQAELNSLRERANRRARDVLSGGSNTNPDGNGNSDVKMEDVSSSNSNTNSNPREVYGFAETRGVRPKQLTTDIIDETISEDQLLSESDPNYGPTATPTNHALLTPFDEALLISFYCSKIPLLIGPHAMLPRCRRDAKVASTASLLFRRFYLSNSVMMHDPKCMLAASAFLATKVEDCMILIGYLEQGTKEMSAEVKMNDILEAEIRLIRGIDFDLLIYSPYKTVLSYTEDLRMFLKSDKGRKLISFSDQQQQGGGEGGESERQLVGEDLRPMHDAAMKICDDVIVSDIPMLFAPGEVGLTALMIANEYVNNNSSSSSGDNTNSGEANTDGENTTTTNCPQIDMMGYIRLRFQDTNNESEGVKVDSVAIDAVTHRITKLGQMIRELKQGKHGCGNYEVNMDTLKGLNKKLKKCRAWGVATTEKKEKKKKKKRKVEDVA